MRSKQPFMKVTSSVTDSDDGVMVASLQLGVIKCTQTAVGNEVWHESSVFYTYITYEGKNYKLMTDGRSSANIVAKMALEKMGLKAEPHPHSYNVNWVDKIA